MLKKNYLHVSNLPMRCFCSFTGQQYLGVNTFKEKKNGFRETFTEAVLFDSLLRFLQPLRCH